MVGVFDIRWIEVRVRARAAKKPAQLIANPARELVYSIEPFPFNEEVDAERGTDR